MRPFSKQWNESARINISNPAYYLVDYVDLSRTEILKGRDSTPRFPVFQLERRLLMGYVCAGGQLCYSKV